MTRDRSVLAGGLLACLALTGCDDAGLDREGRAPSDAAGPRAEYAREFVFVAADAGAAAVLHFTTADLGSSLSRSARGWVEAGEGWIPIFDLSWEGAPLRKPWRLVPHGPIRLHVGLEDEIEAIVVREDDAVTARLDPGAFVAEWAPFRTTQLVLREATLGVAGDSVGGWLIDARFGVAPYGGEEDPDGDVPNGSAAATERTSGGVSGGAAGRAGEGNGAASPLEAATDSLPFAELSVPDALPVRSLKGVLVADDGSALTIGATDAGLAGWFWAPEREISLPLLTLTETAGDPAGYRIESRGGVPLRAEVRIMDQAPAPLAPRFVRGTVTVDGREMEVHGVIRPATE